MSGETFVDTNILIYAYDADAGDKNVKALSAIHDLWDSMKGMVSTQVLQEFYVNATQKIPQPLPHAVVRGIIENYLAWQVQLIYPATILRASEFQERHRLSYWDAMIVAAAYEGNAKTLFTEDLNHGQIIEGIRVINPLRS
ncbi:MAG: twitching motility protein PilT [Deltaproteobacteria bacterium RIFOXYD12_FULL_57_12]|nr:MAG: twitching motility protein PilT [Deltaproteobacteria bacterium RIFOXYD12_FULL_57_12]